MEHSWRVVAEGAKSSAAVPRLSATRRLLELVRLARSRFEEVDVFALVVSEAIERDDIAEAAALPSLPLEELATAAERERDVIEQVIVSEASSLAQADRELRRARASARFWLISSAIVAAAGFIGLVLLLVGFLRGTGFVTAVVAAGVVPVLTVVLKAATMSARALASPQAYASAVATYRLGLLERGVLPFLRERINRALTEDYSLVLRFESARGLSELADEAFEVPTAATEHLKRLIDEMPGGSIGIAGPRGAGKSTLIRAFCTGRFRPPSGLAASVAAPVDYEPRDFILHLYGALCRAIVGEEKPLGALRSPLLRRMAALMTAYVLVAAGVYLIVFDESLPQLSGAQVVGITLLVGAAALVGLSFISMLTTRFPVVSRAADVPFEIVRDAQARLERIRFLQSLSSGWSGELKLPIGGASLNRGRTLIEQETTLPDLVEEFRSFATTVAQVADGLVVGIDELDKIRSTEDAQRFMNDIKGVFGIPKCFFLISISEDALANFDRRGVPVRDAFDSSLDDVVRVGYLPLSGTRRLLQRRVVGLGEGFLCLCHCLAAGLPRDVIRVARAVVREGPAGDAGDPPTLAEVARRLLADDFYAKQHATITAANSLSPLAEVGCALAWLHELRPPEGVDDVRPLSLTSLEGRPDGERAAFRALAQLVDEFAAFSYFSVTALEVFTQLDEPRLRGALQDTASTPFETLARARQSLAVHPRLAWEETTSVRQAWPLVGSAASITMIADQADAATR